MPRHQYVILCQPVAGRETEFEDWYNNQHLADVVKIDGVVSAQRFKITAQRGDDNSPAWQSLAIYNLDADDPEAVMDAIAKAAGGPEMPISEAMSRDALVQILAQQVAAVGPQDL